MKRKKFTYRYRIAKDKIKSYSSFSSWPVLCSLFSSLTSSPCHTRSAPLNGCSLFSFISFFYFTYFPPPSFIRFRFFDPFPLSILFLSARNWLNGLLFALLPCFLLFRLAFSQSRMNHKSFSRKLANCRTAGRRIRFSKIDRKQGLRDLNAIDVTARLLAKDHT